MVEVKGTSPKEAHREAKKAKLTAHVLGGKMDAPGRKGMGNVSTRRS